MKLILLEIYFCQFCRPSNAATARAHSAMHFAKLVDRSVCGCTGSRRRYLIQQHRSRVDMPVVARQRARLRLSGCGFLRNRRSHGGSNGEELTLPLSLLTGLPNNDSISSLISLIAASISAGVIVFAADERHRLLSRSASGRRRVTRVVSI